MWSRELAVRSVFCIWGGPILALAGLWLLVSHSWPIRILITYFRDEHGRRPRPAPPQTARSPLTGAPRRANLTGEQKANIHGDSTPFTGYGPQAGRHRPLASEGESFRQGHEVEYFTLPVRSLLNRCTGVRMPFTWTINPYRGCEFACKYCYARYTHEYMEMRDGADFERKIYVKQDAADLRRGAQADKAEASTSRSGRPRIPISRPSAASKSRGQFWKSSPPQGLDLGIVTKGNMILRDLDVLRQIDKRTGSW